MEDIKKEIKKALISVLASLVFCMCLCFVTMRAFVSYDGGKAHIVHGVLCFSCLFIAIMISAFYAARSLREIYVDSGWKGTDKLPDQEQDDLFDVTFITKDKCILNGEYYTKPQIFVSYDGVTFRRNEVISWCYDHRYKYFIRFYKYAPGYEF